MPQIHLRMGTCLPFDGQDSLQTITEWANTIFSHFKKIKLLRLLKCFKSITGRGAKCRGRGGQIPTPTWITVKAISNLMTLQWNKHWDFVFTDPTSIRNKL